MEPHISTTPFGRRTLTLGHVASQTMVRSRPPGQAAHKWQVFRAICAARARLGVSERALAVLDALLSFHPETMLAGDGLIVFPSNQQLALRAHGMAPATLRRHIAMLVDGGLLIRRDSPNGKRYARKGQGGAIAQAFGFDLSPLVARAAEFEALAEEVRAEQRALKLAREQITLCRRDIVKMIETGMEEGVAVTVPGLTDWASVHQLYREIVGRIPRNAGRAQLEPIADELALLAEEILNILERHIKTQKSSTNESQNERHIQNSNTNLSTDFEPAFEEGRGKSFDDTGPGDPPSTELNSNVEDRSSLPGTRAILGQGSAAGIADAAGTKPQIAAVAAGEAVSPAAALAPLPRLGATSAPFPLGMVLSACPDLQDYSRGGGKITNWRDFLAVASVVRPMLGISPSAWIEAQVVMGELEAAIAIAAILQRGTLISSAGGYLRDLTRKAEAQTFSLGPMLMALIAAQKGVKKRA